MSMMTRRWDRFSSDQRGRPRWILIGFIGFVGFFLRLWVGTAGHNFDFTSFMSVLDKLDISGNVYAENVRYNYGPAWFYLLQILQMFTGLFSHPMVGMEYLLSGFLAFIDIGIYIVLLRSFGLLAGILFILNPVSIIITGYHRQFDNLAILIGLIAVLMIGESFTQPLNRRKVGGLIFLGLSMVTKHLFFAFPLWLAVKQRGWKEKLVVLALPVLIFLLSFAPFWSGGSQGIVDNVFLYEPHVEFQNAPFWHWFLPNIIRFFTTPTIIFLLALFTGAFLLRKKTGLVSLLFYTAILVAASPSIVNQYLAIVVPFISVYMNFFYLLYTVMATWHLVVDKNGLQVVTSLTRITEDLITYSTIIAVFVLGLTWKPVWLFLKRNVMSEVNVQVQEMRSPLSKKDTG